MAQDPYHATPLSRQLLYQLEWLTQLWATGAEPSALIRTTLICLDRFQHWSAHRWAIGQFPSQAHRPLVDLLIHYMGEEQFEQLTRFLDAAAKIPGNGTAEELLIALRYLSPDEQQALVENVTDQWQTQPRFQRLMRLIAQIPASSAASLNRVPMPAPEDIGGHLRCLLEQGKGEADEIQALSLFLLHQLNPAEGQAQASHWLSQGKSQAKSRASLVQQVARAIVQASEEAVALEDCPGLQALLRQSQDQPPEETQPEETQPEETQPDPEASEG